MDSALRKDALCGLYSGVTYRKVAKGVSQRAVGADNDSGRADNGASGICIVLSGDIQHAPTRAVSNKQCAAAADAPGKRRVLAVGIESAVPIKKDVPRRIEGRRGLQGAPVEGNRAGADCAAQRRVVVDVKPPAVEIRASGVR